MMIDRIRVLEMISSFDVEAGGGGLTRFVVTLSRNLKAEHFQPIVCALWDRGSEAERNRIQDLNERGIDAFCCAKWDAQHPYRSFWKAYLGLRAALKQNPVDILHSHSEFSDMAMIFLKLEGKAPRLVRTMHNELQAIWKRRPLRRLLFSQILEPLLIDVELGVSQYITQNLDERWLAKRLKRKAHFVPNALDIHRFRNGISALQEIRSELAIPEEAYLVGSVGRLHRQKGYDVLVEAAAQVVEVDPEIRFIVIGDGVEAQALKEEAGNLGLIDQLIFTGQRQDVEAVLSALDLFVCSSRWEGLSTVLMEAMAAGVPIVATDIPGNRELLRDGANARLVLVEDADALAAGIIAAKQEPDSSEALAWQAQHDVRAFDIEVVAVQHERLYQELLIKKITHDKDL